MNYASVAYYVVDFLLKAINITNTLWGLITKWRDIRRGAPQNEDGVEQDQQDIRLAAREELDGAEQDRADVDHGLPGGRGAPLEYQNTLDVLASLPVLYPEGGAGAVYSGVEILPEDIIGGFDAVVGALKDMPAIEDAPEIKRRLGPVIDVYGRILQDIKEADASDEKHFPERTKRDLDKAEDSTAELYVWAKAIVLNKLNRSGAMTKQDKLQVVPYIMALAYAVRVRIITHLVKRDMSILNSAKERYLNRACEVVHEFIALLHPALEELMANTSLLEIAFDYELPMAMYLTLMMRFQASVDALMLPNISAEQVVVWNDGLSSIREVFHWKPSDSSDQDYECTIQLDNLGESMWWANFTDTDLGATDISELRRSIDIRELSHVLGGESDEIADTLALKPGMKSTLVQLPPASALRDALCANIAQACQAVRGVRTWPPQSFARINAPLPPAGVIAARQTLSGHSDKVMGVAVCANGERVLSGSFDGTVRVWDLNSGQCLHTLSGHTSHVNCAAVSPDGKMAVSGSGDCSVRVWNIDNGSEQGTLQGHTGAVNAVAMSPDGNTIASGSDDKTVKLWNAHTGECKATLIGHFHFVWSVAFIPDGETLVSGSEDWSIRVWNVHTGTLDQTLRAHYRGVTSVAVTPDGRLLVSGSKDWTVRVWNLITGEMEMVLRGHSGVVRCVAVLPDGERIASGSDDKTVRVWNLFSRALEFTLTGHGDFVECVSVSPDGRSVASGSGDRTIKVWPLNYSGAVS